MKKATIFFLMLLILPSLVFSVNNAKVNGQKEITITQLPANIVFTCDLAQAGNKLAFEYFVDMDGDGELGPMEEIMEFFFVTDGIGWIRNPEDPESDFAGDETGVDGKLKTTFEIEADEVFIPSGLTGFLRLVDEDGSTDMVKLTIQIQPQPPFIQGKVTNASNGTPIQGIFVIASDALEQEFMAITDGNGDYTISVANGTYSLMAMQYPMSQFQPSDSVIVTVTNDQSQTQNFALEPYTSYVTGKLTMENGTPVPGIIIFAALSDMMYDMPSMAMSDAQGDYLLGVLPGQVIVSPSFMFNFENPNWPADYYVDPAVDSVNVAEGQTVTSDFVFKPYSSFVTGKCTVNGAGLPGVQISGFAFDMTTFTMNFYETHSDQNGDYRLGVLPGTLTSLTADKEGYDLTSPVGGYMQINVTAGQTVSGKDFQFTPFGTVASISGNVSLSNGSPASNVYVVAENYDEESPEGFLITYTDGSGNYLFENVLDGDYQVGVYYEGYSSEPAMRYFVLWGMVMTGQDFMLNQSTGVASKDRSLKPRTINLSQNFPNPFNPTTTISFDLPSAAQVEINIFNAAGQKIRTLVNRSMSGGSHQVEWDSRNDAGQKITSGVYLYQLKTNNYTKVKKMILAK